MAKWKPKKSIDFLYDANATVELPGMSFDNRSGYHEDEIQQLLMNEKDEKKKIIIRKRGRITGR